MAASGTTRGRRRVSLTVLLSTAIGALIVVSVGTVLAITAGANFRNTLDLTRSSVTLLMSSLESRLRAYVDPAMLLSRHVDRLVADGVLDLSDRRQLKAALAGMLGSSPQVSGVVVWDRDGTRIAVWEPGEGRLRMEETVGSGGEHPPDPVDVTGFPDDPTWTAPVPIDGRTYVNVLNALYRDGAYVGAIATGIDTTDLSELVRELSNLVDRNAFILYGEDRVLAHPLIRAADASSATDPRSGLPVVAGFDDPVVAAFPNREPARAKRLVEFDNSVVDVDGHRYLVLGQRLDGYGPEPWYLAAYADTETVNQQFSRLAGSTLIGLAVLLIAIVAGLLLARYLARPILQLAGAAGQVGELDLEDVRIPRSSFIREIDEQISAFGRMVDGLRKFETYVPRALVRRLITLGAPGRMSSTESERTIMFTDIIGFTRKSEDMAPGEVARMLNDHFTLIDECIEAEGGTIDKYIGDSVMAFWGAPEAQADHAARACRTALAIRRRVAEAGREDGPSHGLRIRVSIHCGPLIVGDIGAPGRINYTVVGDTVNTCSRIEKLCDKADDGVTAAVILASDSVAAAAGEGFEFRPVGSFRVKGKTQPLQVLELAGGGPDRAEATAKGANRVSPDRRA